MSSETVSCAHAPFLNWTPHLISFVKTQQFRSQRQTQCNYEMAQIELFKPKISERIENIGNILRQIRVL